MSLKTDQVAFLNKVRNFLSDDLLRDGSICEEIKSKCNQLLSEMDLLNLPKIIPDASKIVRRRHTNPPAPPSGLAENSYCDMEELHRPPKKRVQIPRKALQFLGEENNRKSGLRGLEELDGEEPSPYSKVENSCVASCIFIERQNFLRAMGVKGKWNKRFGCIREKHLMVFYKETSVSAYLDFPLNAYNIVLKKHDDGKSMLIQIYLQGVSDEGCRFYVEEADAYLWIDVMKRVFSNSVSDEFTISHSPPPLPPPRPSNTLSTPSHSITSMSPRTPVENAIPEKFSTLKRESTADIQKCGLLSIHGPSDKTWTSKICFIQDKQFQAYAGGKKVDEETKIDLQGCRLEIDVSNAQNNASIFRIIKKNSEIISLKALNKDDMAEWVGTLMAEFNSFGSTEMAEMEQIYAECDDNYYISPNTFTSPNNELNIATRVFKRSIKLKKRLASIRRSNGQEDIQGEYINFEVDKRPQSSSAQNGRKPRAATFTNDVFDDVNVCDPEGNSINEGNRTRLPSHRASDPSIIESLKTATRTSLLKNREELDKLLNILRVKEKELTKYYDKTVVLGASIASKKVKYALEQNKVDIVLVCKERDQVNKSIEELTRTKSFDFDTFRPKNKTICEEKKDSESPIKTKEYRHLHASSEEGLCPTSGACPLLNSHSCTTEIKIEISHKNANHEGASDGTPESEEDHKERFEAVIQAFDKPDANGKRQIINKSQTDKTSDKDTNGERQSANKVTIKTAQSNSYNVGIPRANFNAKRKMFEK